MFVFFAGLLRLERAVHDPVFVPEKTVRAWKGCDAHATASFNLVVERIAMSAEVGLYRAL